MKKLLLCLCFLLFVVSLAACSSNTGPSSSSRLPANTQDNVASSPAKPSTNEAESGTEKNNPSILIAYFSRVGNTELPDGVDAVASASINLQNDKYVGNTELLAQWIQEEVGGDLFLIQTTETYPVDYDETVDRGQQEHDDGIRPELASHVENMDDYDVIFLGFPNWWYDMPMAMYSFLEEYDLSGKTVIPFCTSGGSQFSDALDTIRKMQPNIDLLDGLAVRDDDTLKAQSSVVNWLQELGFTQP
jgi:flavodoxin